MTASREKGPVTAEGSGEIQSTNPTLISSAADSMSKLFARKPSLKHLSPLSPRKAGEEAERSVQKSTLLDDQPEQPGFFSRVLGGL